MTTLVEHSQPNVDLILANSFLILLAEWLAHVGSKILKIGFSKSVFHAKNCFNVSKNDFVT
jgi:hypothetical protein